jgi:hypothetical protein
MAKKKFGLSSTLNKNKVEEPVLPAKVPLTRSSKNVEAVKEKVEALHESGPKLNMVEEPFVEISVNVEDEDLGKVVQAVQEISRAQVVEVVEKRITAPKTTKKAGTIPKKPERMVRITVDTPKSMHVKLKIKAIENDITIRDYVIDLIERDLGLK